MPQPLKPRQSPPPEPVGPDGGTDVVDDGQEEVFSRRAIEAGHVKDPMALGPEDLQRRPKSPRRLAPRGAGARSPPG